MAGKDLSSGTDPVELPTTHNEPAPDEPVGSPTQLLLTTAALVVGGVGVWVWHKRRRHE